MNESDWDAVFGKGPWSERAEAKSQYEGKALGGAQMAQMQRAKTANDTQIAGNHYKQFKGHEPWDVVTAWGLGYLDGTALKYISRWKHKGGVEDIKKAIHFLQKLLEVEEGKEKLVGLQRGT